MDKKDKPKKVTNKEQWDSRLILLSRLLVSFSILMLVINFTLYIYLATAVNNLEDIAISIVLLIAGSVIANEVVGLLILSRYPRHAVGWLLLLLGLVTAFLFTSNLLNGLIESGLMKATNPLVVFLLWIGTWAWFMWVVMLIIFIPLYFPDGRLLTRRWRIVVFAGVIATVAMIIALTLEPNILDSSAEQMALATPLSALATFLNRFVVGPLTALTGVAAMLSVILRYRRSQRLQRAQIKWVIFTLVGGIVIFTQLSTIAQFLPWAEPFIERYDFQIVLLFPIALATVIGMSILRYRLYDIDLIIRKTVQYAVITAVLVFVYLGTVVFLQTLVGQATGEKSPIIIILSTLLIAALFNPLRLRVQTAVDRRFYRQKYDAQQVLAQFAQTARDETDMEALQAELLRVAQETMQPETISIWLKQP